MAMVFRVQHVLYISSRLGSWESEILSAIFLLCRRDFLFSEVQPETDLMTEQQEFRNSCSGSLAVSKALGSEAFGVTSTKVESVQNSEVYEAVCTSSSLMQFMGFSFLKIYGHHQFSQDFYFCSLGCLITNCTVYNNGVHLHTSFHNGICSCMCRDKKEKGSPCSPAVLPCSM